MASEFGKRRNEIISFLKALNERERLVVLAYLSNDAAIGVRVPNLAASILEMHRRYHKLELLKLAETEHPTLDLGFLARRKGCRLERAACQPDRWRIHHLHDNVVRHPQQNALTLAQALEALRALPDKENSVKA
jgi:hypothetical protein